VEELVEKMKLLSDNHEMQKKMGIAARKKVEKEFSLNAHCTKLMKIYEELL
jgi:glycosyltransferase involved in cell wall biosynthesis